ncbi:flavodoxin domain-containing protein [Planococcus halotolerans]|uniref:flavodoxin domain-containing protein n=1 Tax=Planococcus halotolerans TaxID=2233542 RepID=UPI001091CFC5|nr:flavodoxin domain-containing protein [Planococcus halotolerans]QHJ70052.1 flavodoxin [Planococcus halotolerans]
MGLMNCDQRIAIVYASVTGNTQAVAEVLAECFQAKGFLPEVHEVSNFNANELKRYDIVVVGTYTWGSGEIPAEMRKLFEAFEKLERPELVTAVFGTGDSFFAEFCGAVNRFRDMLYVHTNLAATLKIELMPQETDLVRCEKFVEAVGRRLVDTDKMRKRKAT